MKTGLQLFSTRTTNQRKQIPGSNQVLNNARGFVWSVDDFTRLRRFLILGADGPTFYASERALVRENADAVLRCIAADGRKTVDEIVAVSVAGRNPKQAPVLFALAACTAAADEATRAYALAVIPKVCRTGTQLFQFVGFVEQFRGWGRGLRNAIAKWYTDRDADALAYQLVKYQQRDGWSHRDVLRLAKPQPVRGSATDLTLRWSVGKLDPEGVAASDVVPALVRAFEQAKLSATSAETAALVTRTGLPWEALPSDHLASIEVWEALLPAMGIGALVRNLGRLTQNGTLTTGTARGTAAIDVVLAKLADRSLIVKSRLHPIAVLSALVTYRNGHGTRGRGKWTPIASIVDALDAAFYASFGSVEPAGARTLLALDVSGSMGGGFVAGVPGLSPRVASAAMAAVTLATEPVVGTIGFTSGRIADRFGVSPLALSSRQRLDDILKTVSGLPFGGTDCAAPMLWALHNGIEVDHFVVYTDSETWAGVVHPVQALRQYREQTGIAARLTVVGMVSNGFSIADPNDPGMLDVVGFDTATPQVMADFAAGRL